MVAKCYLLLISNTYFAPRLSWFYILSHWCVFLVTRVTLNFLRSSNTLLRQRYGESDCLLLWLQYVTGIIDIACFGSIWLYIRSLLGNSYGFVHIFMDDFIFLIVEWAVHQICSELSKRLTLYSISQDIFPRLFCWAVIYLQITLCYLVCQK